MSTPAWRSTMGRHNTPRWHAGVPVGMAVILQHVALILQHVALILQHVVLILQHVALILQHVAAACALGTGESLQLPPASC